MHTNYRQQYTSTWTEDPAQDGAAPPEQFCGGFAESHTYPPPAEIRGSRSNAGFITPTNTLPLSHPSESARGHPSESVRGHPGQFYSPGPPTQGPVHNPTPQMPQPREAHILTPASGQQPQRSVTMPIPDPSDRSDIYLAPRDHSSSKYPQDYPPQQQSMSRSQSQCAPEMLGPAYYSPPLDQRYPAGGASPIQATNSGVSSKAPGSGGASGVKGRRQSERPSDSTGGNCCRVI